MTYEREEGGGGRIASIQEGTLRSRWTSLSFHFICLSFCLSVYLSVRFWNPSPARVQVQVAGETESQESLHSFILTAPKYSVPLPAPPFPHRKTRQPHKHPSSPPPTTYQPKRSSALFRLTLPRPLILSLKSSLPSFPPALTNLSGNSSLTSVAAAVAAPLMLIPAPPLMERPAPPLMLSPPFPPVLPRSIAVAEVRVELEVGEKSSLPALALVVMVVVVVVEGTLELPSARSMRLSILLDSSAELAASAAARASKASLRR